MKRIQTDLKEGISSLARVDRRLTISFGILILALMLSVLITNSFYFKGVMDREEQQLSTLLTQILATSISRVSFSGRYHAQLLLEDTQKKHSNIKYIRITDLKGQILASSIKDSIGSIQTGDAGEVVKNILAKNITNHTRKTNFTNEHVIEISLPYHGGFKNSIQGVVQVGLSRKSRDQEINKGIVLIILMMLLLLTAGIILVRKISRHFGNPIQHLASDMAATLQAIPDLLFELDMDGRYLQIMAHKEELLADTREQLLGKTVSEALPKEASTIIMHALSEAYNNGESHGGQYSLTLPNGIFWFELSIARKFQTTSDKAHFIVLSRDITERKKTEGELVNHREHLEELVRERTAGMESARNEAERANLAKSQFLSHMSHELRTPLNAILGFGQLLEMEKLEQRQQENVTEIINAGYHLLELINEILDLSKIESGNVDLVLLSISVEDLMQQCLSLIQPQLSQHNVKIISDVNHKDHFVYADSTRLKQILLNLLSNAVKYNCDNGSISLNIEVRNNQRLRINVTNTGTILTPEQIGKLFIPFERLGNNNVEGTGIGLVISKHLIEAMGGSIGVESDEIKGNTFWVELETSNN